MWMNLYTEDIHVAPVRALGSGYRFAHPTLRGALGQLTSEDHGAVTIRNAERLVQQQEATHSRSH